MASLSLIFRALIAVTVAIGPMVCCCTSAADNNTHTASGLQSNRTPPLSEGACHGSSSPGKDVSDLHNSTRPGPDEDHAPSDCSSCKDSVLSFDSSSTHLVSVATPSYPDTASFPDSVQMSLGLYLALPADGADSSGRSDFGTESLRALRCLLTV